jgi:hypothetical protein
MHVARRVLARIERIERLEAREAPAAVLLDELRSLVREAEEWVSREGDDRARAAVAKLRGETEGMR